MKSVVISGSVKLQDKIVFWKKHFEDNGYKVLDYPNPIAKENYVNELPKEYKNFYLSIESTDVLFLMNEEKNGIKGYIGASAFAELNYALVLNLIHNRNIKIYILNIPAESVSCYDEVMFWLEMGWIELYGE